VQRVLRLSVVSGFLAIGALAAWVMVPLGLAVGATAAIWILGGLGWSVLVLASAAVAFVPPLLGDERDRAADAVFMWCTAREARRVLGRADRAVDLPINAKKAAAWLRRTPIGDQPLALRVEMLLLAERHGEARAEAELLPVATALDAFRKARALATIAYQAGEPVDDASLRAAAERIPRGLDRTWARADLAVFEARRALPDGDWRAPLLAVRREVPGSDERILIVDVGLLMFTIFVRKVVVPLTVLFIALLLTGTGAIWLASR
jgi:hypothetical protein